MFKFMLAVLTCLAFCSAKKCSSKYTEVTANFDDIKSPNQGAMPSEGYAGLKWEGKPVVNFAPVAYNFTHEKSYPFKGASKPNVLRTDGSFTITTTYKGTLDPFSIKSFDATCYQYVSDVYLKPIPCSFLINVYDYYGLNGGHTYEYNLESTKPKYAKFYNLKGPPINGTSFQFILVGHPVGKHPLPFDTVLNLDNMVFKQTCG